MVETIQTLKMYSSILLVSAVLMALLSIFVAWRYNLLDYYRIKRGKPRKNKQPVIVEKKVSQYYSEVLSSDGDSHEIVNEGFLEDDSVDLQSRIKLGEFSNGVVNQIIDDDAEPMLATSPGRDYLGEDETNLLVHPTQSNDGVEETTVSNAADRGSFSGEEETSLLTYDSVLDETAVTVIGASGGSKGSSTIGSIYDETAVVVLAPDEGVDETTVLGSSSSAKDDSLVDFIDETEVVELNSGVSSMNNSIHPQGIIVNFDDEDEEMPTEELNSFVGNQEQSASSQSDYEGDEETSVLTTEDSIKTQSELDSDDSIISNSKEESQSSINEVAEVMDAGSQSVSPSSESDMKQKDEVSRSLWGIQTSIFAEDDDGILLEHSKR